MLYLRRERWFSNDYVVEEDGTIVANLSRSAWRNRGEITVAGRRLQVKRRGAFRDTFALYDGNEALLEIVQPAALRSKLVFAYEGRSFDVGNRAWYSSTQIVEAGGQIVGCVRSRGLFSGGAVADLPDDLPLAVRVFIAWIALVRWDDEVATAVALGG